MVDTPAEKAGATPCVFAEWYGAPVFRDVRLAASTPDGLSVEGPKTPKPLGLRMSWAATDVP